MDPNVIVQSDHEKIVAYVAKVTGRRAAAAREAADLWAAAELRRRQGTDPDAAIAPDEIAARVEEDLADLVAQDLARIDAYVATFEKSKRAFIAARLRQQRGHATIPDPVPDPVDGAE